MGAETVGVELMEDKKRSGQPAGTGRPDQRDKEEIKTTVVYHTGAEQRNREMEKDREIVRLTLENNKLRRNQHQNCVGCEHLKPGNVFCECKYLGIVNPWEDYCSKRRTARPALRRPQHG